MSPEHQKGSQNAVPWSILASMSAKTIRLRGLRQASRVDLSRTLPVTLFQASHPRQAAITSVVVTVAAAFTGRPFRELVLVFLTVLIGQVILGWHNDLVDAPRDRRHERVGKPVAEKTLSSGNAWYALAIAVLVVVPLSIANGTGAGAAHLVMLVIAISANAGPLRSTRFSYLPWMASFALWPAFLSYGGWGGQTDGGAPTLVMIVLAALLGIGVHLLTSLPGLVHDNEDRFQHFPLVLALKTGAPKLLVITAGYLGVIGVLILIAGVTVGIGH